MVEKAKHSLTEIKTKGGYRLGMVPASLYLPKMETINPDGTTVSFKADQNHIPYLRRSNEFPIMPILENQGGVYGKIPMSDGRVILLASTSSPYVKEGEHIIMWALSGDNFRFQPNVDFMSKEQGQRLFSTAANIYDVFDSKGLTPFIGINSNDQEYQRQSVQSIRDGAHVHCVGIDKKDIAHFKPLDRKEDDRILNDPFMRLTNRLLEKVFIPKVLETEGADAFVKSMITYEDYPYVYPKGTSLVLKDGIDTLRNPNFFAFIQKLHQTFEAEYSDLVKCFTDNKSDTFRVRVDDDIDTISFFRRPKLLPRREILSRLGRYFEKNPALVGDEVVVNGLKYLAGTLKPASQVVVENSTGRDERLNIPIVEARTMNTRIIMDGLSYNMMIFQHPDSNEVLLSIVPRVTTGGSPLDAIGIKKDQYSVSQAEFRRFVKEMDERIDKTIQILMDKDQDIIPGSALLGSPRITPDF